MKSQTKKVRGSAQMLKIGLAILGTIFLGAIGSGIWARIGDPLTNVLASGLINGIDLVFSTYKDSIYFQASLGFREYSANAIYKLFLSVLAIFYVLLMVFHPWFRDRFPTGTLRHRAKESFRSGRGFLFVGVFVFTVLSVCIVEYTRISYINRVITYAHGSIERLAPFLTEQEEEELVAEFRNVRSAKDYYEYYEKLLKLYSEHGIDHRSVRPL